MWICAINLKTSARIVRSGQEQVTYSRPHSKQKIRIVETSNVDNKRLN